MSCPDWRRLAAAGDDFLREDSAERRRALAHAAECPPCRRRALRLDPTLVVSSLPAPPASREEIDAVKRAVMGLRQLREVEGLVRPRRRARARLAAVAVFTAAILLMAEDTNDGWRIVKQGKLHPIRQELESGGAQIPELQGHVVEFVHDP